MCNGTWVCFSCRRATRRPTWRQVTYARPWLVGDTLNDRVRCPSCGQACQFLGPTIKIPPKRDVRGWERLRADVEAFHARAVDDRMAELVNYRRHLESRIAELESRPESAGRRALIADMRAELADVRRDIENGNLDGFLWRRFA